MSTATKILKSARKIFVAKGFAGSSINDIADEAGINKSLIYHHFQSKEGLWRAVKLSIIASSHQETSMPAVTSLKSFFTQIVEQRFQFYEKNPDVPRLMAWQRLEESSKELRTVAPSSLVSISAELAALQKSGELRKDLNVAMVEFLVLATASSAFMDQPDFFATKKGRAEYLAMIVESLYRALRA